jgi:hypothetical protein
VDGEYSALEYNSLLIFQQFSASLRLRGEHFGLAALVDTSSPTPDQRVAALAFLWVAIGVILATLVWPGGRGRRLARQVYAVSVLAFREGVRFKILWTAGVLTVIPGILAYCSDADGTHVGRARLILDTCFSVGGFLGATLIVLMCALSVSREIETRVMYSLGTKPLPRWTILLGKAMGFWAIDVIFIATLVVFAGVLVRAVPLRAETRQYSKFTASGSWEYLRRNALVTRQSQHSDVEPGAKTGFARILPGDSHTWRFSVDSRQTSSEPLQLQMQLSSNRPFSPHIQGVRMSVKSADGTALLERTETVPQDQPFEIFLDANAAAKAQPFSVTIAQTDTSKLAATLYAQRVTLGLAADGFAMNLFKAFVLLALQGWILAIVTTGWSGALSFPVAVALGVLLILGGEMSRYAAELLQSEAARAQALSLEPAAGGLSRVMTEYLAAMLSLLPDFNAAGGPAAFVEGAFVSGWAIAHAALWMGLVRAFGWAIPGVLSFQGREVGK